VWFSRPPYIYNIATTLASTTTLVVMSPNTLFTNINAKPLLLANNEDPINKEFMLSKLYY
jgi:hypothetical protein